VWPESRLLATPDVDGMRQMRVAKAVMPGVGPSTDGTDLRRHWDAEDPEIALYETSTPHISYGVYIARRLD
jgi:hypothetical protein